MPCAACQLCANLPHSATRSLDKLQLTCCAPTLCCALPCFPTLSCTLMLSPTLPCTLLRSFPGTPISSMPLHLLFVSTPPPYPLLNLSGLRTRTAKRIRLCWRRWRHTRTPHCGQAALLPPALQASSRPTGAPQWNLSWWPTWAGTGAMTTPA
jgi:hypothetical protein